MFGNNASGGNTGGDSEDSQTLKALIERTLSGEYVNDRVTSVETYAFGGCTSLTSVDLPAAMSIGVYAFDGCTSLTNVDLPVAMSLGNYAFQGCAALTTLVLRKSDAICTLPNSSVLSNTPITRGTGYIYVPSALIDTYKANSTWSTYANQFRAIEDYPGVCGGGN